MLLLAVMLIGTLAAFLAVLTYTRSSDNPQVTESQAQNTAIVSTPLAQSTSPLAKNTLYVDPNASIAKAAKGLSDNGKTQDSARLQAVAAQPSTIWLVGPSQADPQANRDIEKVRLTSLDAQAQNKVVVYQLYAIPKRDACAGYSMGGFSSRSEYSAWIRKITENLSSKAIILLETDSISQTILGNCLTKDEISQRYELLSEAVDILKASPNILGVYLDGGHSEWFPDSSVLIEPLKKSGVEKANGIAVNVAFFVKTEEITTWAQKLVGQINSSAGIVIDTSRNGNGVPAESLKGEDRWCNPVGRHVGPTPTTAPLIDRVHAYLWVKNIGESDGACNGYPEAGTFVTDIALSLTSNVLE